MKKLLLLALSLSLLAIAPGCKKKDKKKKADKVTKKTKNTKSKVKKGNDKKKKVDKKVVKISKDGKLTVDAYVAAWKNLGSCQLKGYYIDYKCPARKAMRELLKAKKKEKNFYKKIGKKAEKMMFDKNPAIRYWAVGRMGSFWAGGVKNDKIKLLLKLAKDEKNKTVLYNIMRQVASNAKKSPEVAAFILKMADHPEQMIRSEAVSDLATWMVGDQKAFDKILEKIAKDKDIKVRVDALRYSYKHWNEKILPIYKKYLKDPKGNNKLYTAAFEGVIGMWAGMFCKNPSKKAFDMTMKYLMVKPRSDKNPPWTVISSLGKMPTVGSYGHEKDAKWYKKAKHIKVLVDLVKDADFNWLGRTSAARDLGKLKAKKEIEALIKSVGKGKDSNKGFVVKDLKKALIEANKPAK